jgi:hypothetical protein
MGDMASRRAAGLLLFLSAPRFLVAPFISILLFVPVPDLMPEGVGQPIPHPGGACITAALPAPRIDLHRLACG